MSDVDIVDRLSIVWTSMTDKANAERAEAAAEIERLRAERDGYLEGNRQTLRALSEANEIAKRYRRERDQARRMYCDFYFYDPKGRALELGWDCYREETDAKAQDRNGDDQADR